MCIYVSIICVYLSNISYDTSWFIRLVLLPWWWNFSLDTAGSFELLVDNGPS